MSNSQLPVGRVSAMDAKPYVQVAQAGTRQLGRLDLETSKLIAGNTDPHAARAKIPAIANPSSYDAVSRTAPSLRARAQRCPAT
jgi:hypothetical protein